MSHFAFLGNSCLLCQKELELSLSYYRVCLKSLSNACHKIPIWRWKVEFQWLSSGFAKTSHVCLACGNIRLTGIGACRRRRRRRSGTFLNMSWLLSEFNLNFAGMTKSPQCEVTGLIRVTGRSEGMCGFEDKVSPGESGNYRLGLFRTILRPT